MTATIWNGATGNWGNAANWSSAAGAYTLTIGAMAHFTVGMMEMTAPGATLAIAGRLTVGRTFDLAAGPAGGHANDMSHALPSGAFTLAVARSHA